MRRGVEIWTVCPEHDVRTVVDIAEYQADYEGKPTGCLTCGEPCTANVKKVDLPDA